MNFRKKLDIIFDETSNPVGKTGEPWAQRRYIARSLRTQRMGWQVFDRKRQRFLTDVEVKQIKDPRETWSNA
jgi:hypothetical protein